MFECEELSLYLFYSLSMLFYNVPSLSQSIAVSSGTGAKDFEQLDSIVKAIPDIGYICLDVANGYSEHFVDFLRNVRKSFPAQTIMV